jgi:AcrR family transcriptional regulator
MSHLAPQRHSPREHGALTRDQVIEAAVSAIHAGRYEEMTIRTLAADLDVAPMSLYRHIRSRDDLLDEVADRLLSLSWRPTMSTRNWQAWTMDAATRLRNLLVSQPAVLHVYLSHPVTSPAALDRMDSIVDVLQRTGFTGVDARQLYAVLHTYTIGFSALEASRSKWLSTNELSDETTRHLASFTTTAQFKIGLKMILSGVDDTY